MRSRLAKAYLGFALLGLFLVLGVPHARAQRVYGSITGTVTDPTGAVIPKAAVTLVVEQTGFRYHAVTNSKGEYRFLQLQVGEYDLTVSAPGFESAQVKAVRVNLQETTPANVMLKIGSATQSITVNAGALSLQTQTSDITGSITQQQYLKLPLTLGGVGALRSPEAFVFLLPGNTGPGTSNNNSNGVFFSKLAGGQNFGAEVFLDGIDQQRSENGSSFDEEAPSVDALRELTVTDAVPPAEFNRTTGGVENFVTKSGTNKYHGMVYEILRNAALDANLWFNNGYRAQNCVGANDTPACRKIYATPADHKNDYGVTLGGPVTIPHVYNGRNRLFFFFSWEQLKYALGTTATTTVPTPQELSGDFSNPALFNTSKVVGTNPCTGGPVYQGQIFDPSTTRVVNGIECRDPFPGNKIPTQDFSPASKKLLSYFPAPTNSGVFNNYTFAATSPITNTTMTLRIDGTVGKSHIWSSYTSRDNNRIAGTPQILPYPIDPNTWAQDFETHFWRFGWDYTITPNLLNDFTIGSNRSNSKNYAVPIANGINYLQQAGIGNANSNNFPIITNGLTDQEGMPNYGDNIDNGLRLVDNVMWQKGSHSITIGTDDRYQQYSPIVGNSPSINFCGNQTSAYLGSAQNGNGLASELLGDACGGAQVVYAHQSRWISWYFSGYIQDNWNVTQHLTLNLGVNYSVDVPRKEANNFTANFSRTAIDPEYGVPGALVFGTTCSGCNTRWADTYHKDVAPRLGFAWTPPAMNDKTVVRGGFGILYGPLQYDDFGSAMDSGYKANPVFPSKNGFDPSFQIDNGYPAFKSPPNLDPGMYNGTFLPGSYIEKRAGRPAEVYNWDLNVQQQVVKNLILSVGYIGSGAQNLQANNQNINNIPYKDLALGKELGDGLQNNPYGVSVPFPGYFNLWGNGVQIQQALRPFPQYDFIDSGCCLENTGHSTYEAMLVSLQGHFKDLTLQASYTWSKNINDSDSAIPNTNPGQPQVQNPDNLHQEKAISIQDIPNTLVLSYVYALPAGKGQKYFNHGPLSYMLGGWQIGGIQRYQNGEPTAFCCTVGIPGWENATRYDYIPGVNVKSPVYRRGWKSINPFNTAGGSNPQTNSFFNGSDTNGSAAYLNGSATPAFHDQVAAVDATTQNVPYTLGDTPRVTGERMPAWMDEDFSLVKDTPIAHHLTFELKFDILNAFNRHIFGSPNTNPAAFFFGIPTYQANAPRAIQASGNITF